MPPNGRIKAENERLGRWLLGTRPDFRQNREPNYANSPIDRRSISYRNLSSELINLTHAKRGRICVIGPKARPLPAGVETALVNQGYRVLKSNELSALQNVITALVDGTAVARSTAVIKFVLRAYGGLPEADKEFIRKILTGEPQQPRRADRRALWERHRDGTTPALLHDLLDYIDKCENASDKLKESISALRCILEQHEPRRRASNHFMRMK